LYRSLIIGKTVKFVVGSNDSEYDIHEGLAVSNSPFLAEIVKQAQPKLPTVFPSIFRYFVQWVYDKDGHFDYLPDSHFQKKTSPGHPYLPLIRLYTLAHKLRTPTFANAVLKKIIETHKDQGAVVDNHSIKFLYHQKQQNLEIHDLFVHQVSYYADEADLESYDNFTFVKAVLGQLPAIRDNHRPKHPGLEAYCITEIDDPDECVFVSERPAPTPEPPTTQPPRFTASTSTIFDRTSTAEISNGQGRVGGRPRRNETSPLFEA
jgi:hypothetical protein